MLSKESIEYAQQLTDVLENAGLYVSPHPETPLAQLAAASRVNDKFVSLTDGAYTVNVDDVLYMANNPDVTTGISDHDQVGDEIAKVVPAAVQAHISVARNVVAPLIDDLVTRTIALIGNTTVSSLLGMEVVVLDQMLPLNNPAFARMVENMADVPYDSPALNINIPPKTAAELVDMMKTGVSSLDTDVAGWLASKGESFLIDTWERFFTKTPLPDFGAPLTFRSMIEDRDVGTDRAIVVFLLARRLIDEIPEGISMSLPDYNNAMADFRNQAGKVLEYAIGDQRRKLEAGMLVSEVRQNKIYVNGAVYSTWIANGGNNEVLFGNILRAPPLLTVSAIDEAATQLLADWKRYESLTMSLERNKRFINIKKALREIFQAQVQEAGSEELVTLGGSGEVLRLFENEIDAVTDGELDNLYVVACKLICRSRFYKTSSERILLGIDNYKRNNPEISVREAAELSIIEYVCDWVASQFSIKTL